ncbi:V4R domain-containing protein [Tuwongella immobilis]|uniref:4-vinyl reductase 4VR n=1 Tax=Tuwongella immobilis TaxID=692036 RepID=A0A6C2YJ50_9BACT|nr:V4R domain-containing protein [Tuwongella immobilis]VIP01436.1 4-vinyl reductase 4VR OS=Isosphaera pallida (strain ATCC 43644 / DSM 9630 / IS1B) GN=Isop_2218 PE=4 SV=1 [Tuwongella immobilis]VTR98400.1 4-vinyl reductase 4VR OS=Isosphaera pallida (strain ATCC 43644 / DSM 9630 / IS1B) GN=Isop_2218 PE=4 SV=1 [Tuwongella immobilis]
MSDTVDLPLRLKGNYYAQPGFFTTDPATGVTRTPTKSRICAVTNDFVTGFRDAVIFECGKSYRRVLKAVGRRWGVQFIKRFDTEISAYYQTPLAELSTGIVHTCLADAFNYHGWGKLRIDFTLLDRGVVLIDLRNSMMPALVPESDRPVDLMMAGMLGAIFSHLSGQALEAVQTDCPSQGAESCKFLIASTPAIAEIEAWLNKSVPNTTIPHDAILKRLLSLTDPGPAAEESTATATAEDRA